MDVGHEHGIAKLLGEIIPQVNHRPTVSMPAARAIALVITGMRALVAKPVDVIPDWSDVFIGIGVEMLPGLAEVVPALNHVIQMRNHAGGHERLPLIVPVD